MVDVAVALGANREMAETDFTDVLEFETHIAQVSAFFPHILVDFRLDELSNWWSILLTM